MAKDNQDRLDSHEKVCTERYGNIWDAIKDLKATVQKNDSDMKAVLEHREAITHGRFNTISTRIFAAIASTLGMAVVGLGGLVFYLLTTKGHL